ncbi:PREDICTED: testis-expressed sequence 12 protein isoform X4 [Myotis brandtii]|uniref:testis-expressed sequence 12 protein isoform X4 n=1 Tax=Myotis brandtii TaxID=109478 RepID=UPI0007040540|nr:PREDICTED: testis-expressed sequence 12 protein isoform X4 [Myotis brandtii]
MFRISIFEIAGQSRHIKAPNRLSFKDVGHACYKIYFFESCQLSELNSFTHQESDFRRFRDSRSSVAPKKKGSRDEGSDQEVLLAARGTQYKPFRHPNHLESDVNVAGRTVLDLSLLLPQTGKRTEIFVLWRFHVEGMSGREAEGKSRFR